ncbi:MAG: hypothetical protein GXP30_06345, partial [Verrucomicrobia bacterium]|nr:hypothetical protein [Verrucomicrobiota bacterium]
VLCRARAYRRVRHPMYGAVLLAALMVAWADGRWLNLFCWLGLIAVLWVKSSLEEKWLGERYSEYEAYRRITPRWIPFGPMASGQGIVLWLSRLSRVLYILVIMTLVWQAVESSWDADLFDVKTARNIRAKEAAQLIDSIPDLLVLDVRSEWEFTGRHLPGAVNIPINDPEFDPQLRAQLSGKSAVLIYCAGGYRSRQGVGRIQRQGVTLPIYHLHRGMMDWWWSIKATSGDN